jgi:hypothetical protein
VDAEVLLEAAGELAAVALFPRSRIISSLSLTHTLSLSLSLSLSNTHTHTQSLAHTHTHTHMCRSPADAEVFFEAAGELAAVALFPHSSIVSDQREKGRAESSVVPHSEENAPPQV